MIVEKEWPPDFLNYSLLYPQDSMTASRMHFKEQVKVYLTLAMLSTEDYGHTMDGESQFVIDTRFLKSPTKHTVS